MDKFTGATILLPAMDETYSLEQTVDIIMQTCSKSDLAEIIIIVCEKSTAQCLQAARKVEARYGAVIPVSVRFQLKPFVGGAVQEGFDVATGSHIVLMSSDLETDPHLVADFIRIAKETPNKIVTATRWRKGGGFVGYNKVKLVANLIFQKLIAALFLSGLSDLTYGYRIFPACLVKAIWWRRQSTRFSLKPHSSLYDWAWSLWKCPRFGEREQKVLR